jgi:GPH family glycoside/pentoside/hexuronide:cation symporter
MLTPPSDHLSRRTKLAYGAGDIGFSLTDTTIGVLFSIFLLDVVQLDPGLAAFAVFLGRSWDYINDPIMGYLSDRARTRWGRRRPFLLFGFIPFALGFAAMWWIPPTTNQYTLAAYYAFAYLVYDACATFVYMPYYALTPELTPDYDERTTLTAYRMAFSIIGGLIAFTVPLGIIGAMRPENAWRVAIVGLAMGILSGIPLLITFLGTRERPEYMQLIQPGLKESLRAAVKNQPFLFASGVFLFTWTAVEFIQAMLLFFLKYRMNLEKESDVIAGVIFIVALVTLPFWEWASRRWDKRKTYIAGMLFMASVMVTLIFLNPSLGFRYVMAMAALAGIGLGAIHVLTWAMIPDAVEWDELATGERHEGTFYSLVTLMRKVASSIVIPVSLLILGHSGYIPNAARQPESAVTAIRVLVGPAPSILLIGGILFASFYPLSRQRHQEVRQEIAERKGVLSQSGGETSMPILTPEEMP